MKFFFNKKQEKCLVSHFEYFYKEKKVVFPSVRMVTLSGRDSVTIFRYQISVIYSILRGDSSKESDSLSVSKLSSIEQHPLMHAER